MQIFIRSALALVASVVTLIPGAHANGEVNLYSYRQPFLIQPMLDAFTVETGIKVNIVFAKKGMLQKIKAAGANNPADAVLTVDIGRLDALAQADLLAPIKSETLQQHVPTHLRHPDGLWFGLTTRARVVLASKDRVADGEIANLSDLIEPRFKGRVCTRSGKHVYNVGLLAAMIAHDGEAATQAWLAGLKANLARKPQGNDRAQAKAIYEGGDVAITNHYYMGKMATAPKPERKWADAKAVFTDQNGQTAPQSSGAGVLKNAKNRDNAIKMLEFLVARKLRKCTFKTTSSIRFERGLRRIPCSNLGGRLSPTR